MRFFLTQFIASAESTRWYLKHLSIAQENRIFFAIFIQDNLVGHIGLSDISDTEAELDNIIRGVSGGHSDLMYFSERTILDWAFHSLNVSVVTAQVMSRNFLAMSLHERFGFSVKVHYSLMKKVEGKVTSFKKCPTEQATEKFGLDIVELNIINFKNFDGEQ